MKSKLWNWIGWGAVGSSVVLGGLILLALLRPVPKRTTLYFYLIPQLKVMVVGMPTAQGEDLFILDTGSTRNVDIYGQKVCISYICADTELPDMYMAKQMILVDKFLPEDFAVRGLVGGELLEKFSKIEIDYKQNTVSFEE